MLFETKKQARDSLLCWTKEKRKKFKIVKTYKMVLDEKTDEYKKVEGYTTVFEPKRSR